MSEPEIIKGKWHDITRPEEVREIAARYDRVADWKMDPAGYFLIRVEREAGVIRAAFCSAENHEVRAEVVGGTALDIVNTLIRERMVSTLQHAGDLGAELQKAELALKHDWEYVQDSELKFEKSN